MKLGIIRLYTGESGEVGYYNIQELGLAKALAKKGISTDIFFLVDKRENKEIVINQVTDKVRVIYIPAIKFANHGIISPKFILDYKLDIVHLLSDNQLMVPSFIKFCNKNNIPVYSYVGTIESDTNNKLKKIVMDFIAKRNIDCFKKSNIVVKTPNVKEKLEGYGVENVKLIPVGLDLDIIPNVDLDKYELRKELNISIDKKILLFVGRLEEYKNPIKAIELFKELRKTSNDYILIVIGQGSLKSELTSLIENYKLNNDVILIDKIQNTQIHRYYKACDMFLNFNNKEIFGMSILEAMYQGCKVTAINAPGPNFIIDNEINGVILKDFSFETWIRKIEQYINDKSMAIKARERIEKNLNWDSIAKEYIELFKEIKGE